MRTKHSWAWIATAIVGMSLLVAGTSASAAEAPTREEYVSQLEAICKPDVQATQKAMKGSRAAIQAERFDAAANKFSAAYTIFSGTVKNLLAVPQPEADAVKLEKWFGYLKAQEGYIKQIPVQLHADHPIPAQRLIARFIHNGNLANNTVLAFGFDYCSFKFSRFG
ncbi:MAG TPA: hypothetical protein VGO36_05125 [Solirubrobacterales bacterium]|nr:hypothetical protein [Solirubrobacterales bacterium]